VYDKLLSYISTAADNTCMAVDGRQLQFFEKKSEKKVEKIGADKLVSHNKKLCQLEKRGIF